jgi:hypothetical protein
LTLLALLLALASIAALFLERLTAASAPRRQAAFVALLERPG